jgi:hypothetical protein
VAPTLLDLAGAAMPAGMEGLSLRPLLTGTGDVPERPVTAVGAYTERPVATVREGRVFVPPPGTPAGRRTDLPPGGSVWLVDLPPSEDVLRGSIRVSGGRVRWAWGDGFAPGDRLDGRGSGAVFSVGPGKRTRRVLFFPDPPEADVRLAFRSKGALLPARRIALGGAALRPEGNPFRLGRRGAGLARSPWYPAVPADGEVVSVHLVDWRRYAAAAGGDAAIGGALRDILGGWGYLRPR